MVLLGQLQDATLQNHVVESAFLPRPLGRLVVPSTTIPVAVVFLVVRNEFPLLPLLIVVVVVVVVAV